MAKKGHIHTTHQNMPCGRAVPWEFQEMMCFLEHYAMMWLQSVLGIGFPLLAERGDLYLYLGCRAVAVSVVSKPLATAEPAVSFCFGGQRWWLWPPQHRAGSTGCPGCSSPDSSLPHMLGLLRAGARKLWAAAPTRHVCFSSSSLLLHDP